MVCELSRFFHEAFVVTPSREGAVAGFAVLLRSLLQKTYCELRGDVMLGCVKAQQDTTQHAPRQTARQAEIEAGEDAVAVVVYTKDL